MRHFRTCAVLALGAALWSPTLSQSGNWWDQDPWSLPDRGFNWYPPDAPPQARPPDKPAQKPPEAAKPKPYRDMAEIADLRKEVERLRDIAVMAPTEKHILAYLEANNYLMDKAALFSDVWRRVVWANPQIDYNARSPQANFAQLGLRDKMSADADALMLRLAQTHGMVFFYRGDCVFCHMQAPILKMLRDKYRIEVLAISMDGAPMPAFPDARRDNGISLKVSQGRGVDMFPALYLVSRDQQQVLGLGSGVIAMEEIVERIRVLHSTRPGENF